MTDRIHDAMAQHATDYRVGDRLHAVPPHEVYEVFLGDRRAVCKLATEPTGEPVAEAAVTDHVDRHTPVPVPPVLAAGRDPDHFVAGWIDDAPEEGGGFDDDDARAVGRCMATLHDATPFEAPGFPTAREASELPAGTDDPPGSPTGGLAVDARESANALAVDYLRNVREYLRPRGYGGVATPVIELLRECEPLADAGDPVLCHGNLLPDHAAVADGEVTRVIDFEHALVAPAEYDYWRTGMPCFEGPFRPGASTAPDDPIHEAFDAGYRSVRDWPPEGFRRRAPVYWLVNSVSYLRALFVQNEFDQGVARRARRLGAHVEESVAALRERFDRE